MEPPLRRPMITRITVENFKSYRRAELPLGPLTLLIGANASGKTNVIEAVRFLALLAKGQHFDALFADVVREEVDIRGTVQDLTYNEAETFSLGCQLDGPVDGWDEFAIGIRLEKEGMRAVEERLTSWAETVPLYEIKEPGTAYRHEAKVAYNNFARGGKKPTIWCSDQRAIFTQLDTPSRFTSRTSKKVIPQVVEEYRARLGGVRFLDPKPSRMRGYSFIVDDVLLEDGRNLSSVLYRLVTGGRKAEVLEFVRELPEQDFSDVEFHATPRSEVMVRLEETFGGQSTLRDAPVLSDGTLRVLAVAAALLSAPEGSLVIIEEIDNGVHPSRAGRLLRTIRRVATERGLSVLLTSHNPALLDTLPDEAVPDVVACYRDPDGGDSRLVRLEELTEYPALVARGPLGRLMTKGILERTLKHRQTEEERRAEAVRQTEEFLSQVGGGVVSVAILDTSVFCNLLRVPGKEQHAVRARTELRQHVADGAKLLLPLAAVYETGNHIAQAVGDRHRIAGEFADWVRRAFEGTAPFTPAQLHDLDEILDWLDEFPSRAAGGVGIGDLSILRLWEEQRSLNPYRRVFVWSYDGDLASYDTGER